MGFPNSAIPPGVRPAFRWVGTFVIRYSSLGYQNTGTVYPLTMGRPIADSVVNGPFKMLSVADRLSDKFQDWHQGNTNQLALFLFIV